MLIFGMFVIAESDIFEINATPYSPFSADKSTKNLGYLGRGYDVLFGNPLDESGRVDPGKLLFVPRSFQLSTNRENNLKVLMTHVE
jgi:hypothetical protein